jgi:hypothetical protein
MVLAAREWQRVVGVAHAGQRPRAGARSFLSTEAVLQEDGGEVGVESHGVSGRGEGDRVSARDSSASRRGREALRRSGDELADLAEASSITETENPPEQADVIREGTRKAGLRGALTHLEWRRFLATEPAIIHGLVSCWLFLSYEKRLQIPIGRDDEECPECAMHLAEAQRTESLGAEPNNRLHRTRNCRSGTRQESAETNRAEGRGNPRLTMPRQPAALPVGRYS